jgi:hypothetical protein
MSLTRSLSDHLPAPLLTYTIIIEMRSSRIGVEDVNAVPLVPPPLAFIIGIFEDGGETVLTKEERRVLPRSFGKKSV